MCLFIFPCFVFEVFILFNAHTQIQEQFKKEGIDVHTGVTFVKVVKMENNQKVITVKKGNTELNFTVDTILVATGR